MPRDTDLERVRGDTSLESLAQLRRTMALLDARFEALVQRLETRESGDPTPNQWAQLMGLRRKAETAFAEENQAKSRAAWLVLSDAIDRGNRRAGAEGWRDAAEIAKARMELAKTEQELVATRGGRGLAAMAPGRPIDEVVHELWLFHYSRKEIVEVTGLTYDQVRRRIEKLKAAGRKERIDVKRVVTEFRERFRVRRNWLSRFMAKCTDTREATWLQSVLNQMDAAEAGVYDKLGFKTDEGDIDDLEELTDEQLDQIIRAGGGDVLDGAEGVEVVSQKIVPIRKARKKLKPKDPG